jgi:hypothetical protein
VLSPGTLLIQRRVIPLEFGHQSSAHIWDFDPEVLQRDVATGCTMHFGSGMLIPCRTFTLEATAKREERYCATASSAPPEG